MSFCTKCGAQVDANAKFCPSCGAINGTSEPAASGAATPPPSTAFNAAPPAPGATPAPNQVNTPLGNINFSFDAATAGVADPQDVAANKGMAILSYILFFIPLIAGTHKTSPFVRFHVNQGTALFIANFIYCVVLTIIQTILGLALPVSVWIMFNLVFGLLYLVSPVFVILGIINAANGTLKQLPVIGGLNIIK